MKSLDDKKQVQINRAQQIVIESFESREDGSKDYTLDEAFRVIEKNIAKQSIYSR